MPKCEGAKEILLLLGVISLLSQVSYFALSLIVKVQGLGWKPPYRTMCNVSIALVCSFIALNIFEQVSEFDGIAGFVLKSFIILIAYLVSVVTLNKKINPIQL